eukprot:Anaeramoba_ignava/a498000_46.p1 GENE.a498000_46~~a498000_46.p1  ORF type:complete len:133 (+),score=39.06 a498000_46:25-423(+)
MLSRITEKNLKKNQRLIGVPIKRFLASFTLIDTTGNKTKIDYDPDDGMTLLDIVNEKGINTIHAKCQGALACAECHVYVDSQKKDSLTQPEEEEQDCLKSAKDPKPNSRLACGLVMDEKADGLTVTIAPYKK